MLLQTVEAGYAGLLARLGSAKAELPAEACIARESRPMLGTNAGHLTVYSETGGEYTLAAHDPGRDTGLGGLVVRATAKGVEVSLSPCPKEDRSVTPIRLRDWAARLTNADDLPARRIGQSLHALARNLHPQDPAISASNPVLKREAPDEAATTVTNTLKSLLDAPTHTTVSYPAVYGAGKDEDGPFVVGMRAVTIDEGGQEHSKHIAVIERPRSSLSITTVDNEALAQEKIHGTTVYPELTTPLATTADIEEAEARRGNEDKIGFYPQLDVAPDDAEVLLQNALFAVTKASTDPHDLF